MNILTVTPVFISEGQTSLDANSEESQLQHGPLGNKGSEELVKRIRWLVVAWDSNPDALQKDKAQPGSSLEWGHKR